MLVVGTSVEVVLSVVVVGDVVVSSGRKSIYVKL